MGLILPSCFARRRVAQPSAARGARAAELRSASPLEWLHPRNQPNLEEKKKKKLKKRCFTIILVVSGYRQDRDYAQRQHASLNRLV